MLVEDVIRPEITLQKGLMNQKLNHHDTSDIRKISLELVGNIKNKISIYDEVCNTKGVRYGFTELNTCLETLQIFREGLSKKDEEQLKFIFCDLINPFIHLSAFAKHIFTRPRGYVGDFITMEEIWESRKMSFETKFDNLADAINHFTLMLDNNFANIYRVFFLKELILSKDWDTISSIGSGSAIELKEAFSETMYRPKYINLLDQDQGALDAAFEKIEPFGVEVNKIHGNVLKSVLGFKFKKSILVYSTGLFDYFTIPSSKKIAKLLWDMVVPGGCLVITNAHPKNPSKLWMEYGGDWYLEYKTKNDLLEIIYNLENKSKVTYSLDPFNIYQYLKVFKKEKKIYRIV